MTGHANHARYLKQLIAVTVFFCIAGALANLLVDPYGLFSTPRIHGFNEKKPAAAERVRVAKPYMATAARPTTIIGGNSRPEMGLDPGSPCWSADEQPVFNIAIPGASFHMQAQYAKHAASAGRPTHIFMGVDFVDFLVDSRSQKSTIDWGARQKPYAGRLSIPGAEVTPYERFAMRLVDRFNGLFSVETLVDSLHTVATQGAAFGSDRRADGFNPADDYIPIIRSEGQHVLFVQKNRELAATLSRPGLGLFDYRTTSSEALESLKALLKWSGKNGIEITLFINPYHAHYLRLIELSGHWGLFERWKREVSSIAADHGVTLWDFNTVDRHATESPPEPGDRHSQLRWFWEPAHYTAAMGELMLSKMLARNCADVPPTAAPGAKLEPRSIDLHLEKLARDLADYVSSNDPNLEHLRKLQRR